MSPPSPPSPLQQPVPIPSSLLARASPSERLRPIIQLPRHLPRRRPLNRERNPLLDLQLWSHPVDLLLAPGVAGDCDLLFREYAQRLRIAVLLVSIRGVVREGPNLEDAAEERPEHRKIRDIDCGRGLADVPQHVDGGIWI